MQTLLTDLRLNYVNKIKTIHSSLRIEGNTLTREQVTAIIENKKVIGPKRDIIEVRELEFFVNVTLHWEDHHRSGISNTDDLVVARYDGEKWVDYTNLGGVSETLAYGYVTSEAITSFSPFIFGSTSDANPLPVEFLDFQAESSEPVVLLRWVTASEINNDFFTIERSLNGIDFEEVKRVQGAGTSSQVLHYQDTDPLPLPGNFLLQN